MPNSTMKVRCGIQFLYCLNIGSDNLDQFVRRNVHQINLDQLSWGVPYQKTILEIAIFCQNYMIVFIGKCTNRTVLYMPFVKNLVHMDCLNTIVHQIVHDLKRNMHMA